MNKGTFGHPGNNHIAIICYISNDNKEQLLINILSFFMPTPDASTQKEHIYPNTITFSKKRTKTNNHTYKQTTNKMGYFDVKREKKKLLQNLKIKWKAMMLLCRVHVFMYVNKYTHINT